MDASFDGFSPAAMGLLDDLGAASKEWFAEHRPLYETELAAPGKAFVVEMGDRLAQEVSPDIVALPRSGGSISPINNDLRFRPDAAPYKDHVVFRFWEGSEKKTAPTLFVRLSPEGVGFAAGMVFGSVPRWRDVVAGDDGVELVDALAELGTGRDLDIAGRDLKRVPAPHPADHPRGDLLRHKAFQVRWMEQPGDVVGRPEFVDYCAERLVACVPVHTFLRDRVA